MNTIDLSKFSAEELEQMLAQKRQDEKNTEKQRRDAYEGIKADMISRVQSKVDAITLDVKALHKFIVDETTAFYEVMKDYGQLRREDQMSFTVKDNDFKVEVSVNKCKKFDERADIAAKRLVDFLRNWIAASQQGEDDPMYQLAMTLVERNEMGELDYKSISKLYALESKFADNEYSEIMQLFKESNVVDGTTTNFYFYKRNELGVWNRVEPSFNRIK